ncbi:IS30 family transposase [Microcystis sp. M169S2]|uniref:IS30 family transposase n=1 Tax=Microcystis sp. M169S2 TaxID=2771157 RepID=UPI0025902BC7|nr:IS30 family transposase [Microcystis sp. M169S2]
MNILHNSHQVSKRATPLLPNHYRKTFTCDNGKEFCGHQELIQKLGADFYFATPYHSWERGLNEHTNRLLRQFFLKGTNIKMVKPEQVERAINLINNRPRKCLDYQTANEVSCS